MKRGIAGDCVGGWQYRGLLDRLEVSCHALKPSKVFIKIGVNDLIDNQKAAAPKKELYRGYREIIQQIQQRNPQANIYISSILPIAHGKYAKTNGHILEVNKKIKKIANEMKVTFVDMHQLFANPDRRTMQKKLTYDTIHLTKEGYALWLEQLEKIMKP